MKPLFLTLPKHPFDYVYLMDRLKEYRSPRSKVGLMIRKEEILRIKKGLYVLSPEYGGEIDKRVLSNLIYGPSYISFEYALSYWGLIPEKVEELTCVTNKRKKTFSTPVGRFSYAYLPNPVFAVGGCWLEQSFFIASKEKALCDKVATIREITQTQDIQSYLETDLRVDMDELLDLDLAQLQLIKKTYRKKQVTLMVNWIQEQFFNRENK